jgi:hypothetical protein
MLASGPFSCWQGETSTQNTDVEPVSDNLVLARKLLDIAPPKPEDAAPDPATPVKPCPCCGSAMRIIEVFKAGQSPRHRPTAMPAAIRIDTS